MRGNQRSEPVVQPTVAYGRCVTGNGGVLSVLTMYSGLRPAEDRREGIDRNLPAVGGEEARLSGDADTLMVGGKTPPNPHMLSTRNWVSPYRCPLGRRTARNAVADAGRGGRKKRRLVCNGRDRGLNVTPRETGLTCGWSFLSKRVDKNSSRASEGGCFLTFWRFRIVGHLPFEFRFKILWPVVTALLAGIPKIVYCSQITISNPRLV